MSKISTIYFVRHGESTINVGGILNSQYRHKLTGRGKKQAKVVAKIFKDHKFDQIIVSSFDRTKQTATPLTKYQKKKYKIWPVQEFMMFAPARYSKITLEQRRKEGTVYWQKCDPDYRDGRGAETYRELTKRADEVIQKIIKLKFDNIIIFSHGNFIRHLVWRILQPHKQLNHEVMESAARFGWGMTLRNTEFVKVLKIDNRLYVGEVDSRHVKD